MVRCQFILFFTLNWWDAQTSSFFLYPAFCKWFKTYNILEMVWWWILQSLSRSRLLICWSWSIFFKNFIISIGHWPLRTGHIFNIKISKTKASCWFWNNTLTINITNLLYICSVCWTSIVKFDNFFSLFWSIFELIYLLIQYDFNNILCQIKLSMSLSNVRV